MRRRRCGKQPSLLPSGSLSHSFLLVSESEEKEKAFFPTPQPLEETPRPNVASTSTTPHLFTTLLSCLLPWCFFFWLCFRRANPCCERSGVRCGVQNGRKNVLFKLKCATSPSTKNPVLQEWVVCRRLLRLVCKGGWVVESLAGRVFSLETKGRGRVGSDCIHIRHPEKVAGERR